jgi:hypothetical protein
MNGEWTQQVWEAHIDRIVRRHAERTELMSGRSYLSSEELAIIHSSLPSKRNVRK